MPELLRFKYLRLLLVQTDHPFIHLTFDIRVFWERAKIPWMRHRQYTHLCTDIVHSRTGDQV